MADLITFNIVLPPVGAPDVVVRELTISVEGKDTIVQNLDAVVTAIHDLSGPQGAEVSVSLVDIDDAGNRSPQVNATTILTDIFSPPAPDQIGFELTGEVHSADPAPEPEPTPEPEAPADVPVNEETLANDPAPEDPEA